jgi:hypothetical protein
MNVLLWFCSVCRACSYSAEALSRHKLFTYPTRAEGAPRPGSAAAAADAAAEVLQQVRE